MRTFKKKILSVAIVASMLCSSIAICPFWGNGINLPNKEVIQSQDNFWANIAVLTAFSVLSICLVDKAVRKIKNCIISKRIKREVKVSPIKLAKSKNFKKRFLKKYATIFPKPASPKKKESIVIKKTTKISSINIPTKSISPYDQNYVLDKIKDKVTGFEFIQFKAACREKCGATCGVHAIKNARLLKNLLRAKTHQNKIQIHKHMESPHFAKEYVNNFKYFSFDTGWIHSEAIRKVVKDEGIFVLDMIEQLKCEHAAAPKNQNTHIFIVNTTTPDQLKELEKRIKKEKHNPQKVDNMISGSAHHYVVAIQKKEKKFYIVDTDGSHINNKIKLSRNKLLCQLVNKISKK